MLRAKSNTASRNSFQDGKSRTPNTLPSWMFLNDNQTPLEAEQPVVGVAAAMIAESPLILFFPFVSKGVWSHSQVVLSTLLVEMWMGQSFGEQFDSFLKS
jgi:hypothetical protein